MAKIKGVVEKITKNNGGFYSLKVDGKFFGVGKKQPKVNEGDMVDFTYTSKQVGENTYYNADVDTLEVETAPKETTSSQAAPEARTATFRDSRQDSIEYQNSRTAAITAVLGAYQQGILAAPASKAGKKDAFDILLGQIEDVTVRFFDDVSTMRLLKAREAAPDTTLDEDDDE